MNTWKLRVQVLSILLQGWDMRIVWRTFVFICDQVGIHRWFLIADMFVKLMCDELVEKGVMQPIQSPCLQENGPLHEDVSA